VTGPVETHDQIFIYSKTFDIGLLLRRVKAVTTNTYSCCTGLVWSTIYGLVICCWFRQQIHSLYRLLRDLDHIFCLIIPERISGGLYQHIDASFRAHQDSWLSYCSFKDHLHVRNWGLLFRDKRLHTAQAGWQIAAGAHQQSFLIFLSHDRALSASHSSAAICAAVVFTVIA
jgi:hypothetical protein